jgi:hypothetical protein
VSFLTSVLKNEFSFFLSLHLSHSNQITSILLQQEQVHSAGTGGMLAACIQCSVTALMEPCFNIKYVSSNAKIHVVAYFKQTVFGLGYINPLKTKHICFI